MAGWYDLPMRRGDTFGPRQFAFKQADGEPVDLTGSEIRFTFQKRGGCELVKSTATSGATFDDATAGLVTLSQLTTIETKDFAPGDGARWTCQRVLFNPDGSVANEETLIEGRQIVSEEI